MARGFFSILFSFVIFTATARAEVVKFEAMLAQDQAVPAPIKVPDAGGRAYITLDTDTNEVAWNIEYYTLSGEITGIHFHGPAGAGKTAGIAVVIDNTSKTTGKLIGSAQLTAMQAQQLMDEQVYINVHTELNPDGEIRGQVIKQ